jgi:hypothetical protein
MPSPFPGMDPFVEGSVDGTMHAMMTTEVCRQLVPRLGRHYVILPQERWIMGFVPRVGVEITDHATGELVTAIEILKPEDKQLDGRQEYDRVRSGYERRGVNVIEIDLLRAGRRTQLPQPLPPTDFVVMTCRSDRPGSYDVWPISLRDRLPVIPVPLRAGEAPVLLDLQEAFTEVYDVVRFDRCVNYRRPPVVPFRDEDVEWVAEILSRR